MNHPISAATPRPATLRIATPEDTEALCDLHRHAFGTTEGPQIANLIQRMLDDPTAQPLLSLIAETSDQGGSPTPTLAGHLLFSAAWLAAPVPPVSARILAPLAVLPSVQRQGIGSQLIRSGLRMLADTDVELVFVYGDPDYYGRFGFRPATPLGLIAPRPIPAVYADAWMYLGVGNTQTIAPHGTVRCSTTLEEPAYW